MTKFFKFSGDNCGVLVLCLISSLPQSGSAQQAELLEDTRPNFSGTVLLRNSFLFNDGRNSSGASAVIVQTPQGVSGVTARHLLGLAMGVEPEILPSEFERGLDFWRLHVPRSPTQSVNADKLTFPLSDGPSADILVFSLEQTLDEIENLGIGAIGIAENDPVAGEINFLFGCPYIEQECAQNTYSVQFVNSSSGRLTYTLLDADVPLSGFSGAPFVNDDGELVGILTNSSTDFIFGERITQQCVDAGVC